MRLIDADALAERIGKLKSEEKARAVTDKERIIEFVKKIIPDDFRCGHISITFAEDDSAFITIGNRE